MNTMGQGVIMLLAAPSGAGKTTLCEGLMARNPNLGRVVTCTTRVPRAGERDGVDYHFFSPETFAAKVAAGEFLEHANVYGRCYGTLKASVSERLAAGGDALLAIDVQGAATVRGAAAGRPDLEEALFSVFLTPAGGRELETRLRGRGSEDAETLARRLASAEEEVARWPEFDYLIVSGSREEDLRRAEAIYHAERMRTRRSVFQFGP